MSMSSELRPKSIGKRLRFLRKAKGVDHQTVMAKHVGVSQSRYSNWENGIGVIPVEFAVKFCQLTGATLDFIYTGNQSSLPMYLASMLAGEPDVLGKAED